MDNRVSDSPGLFSQFDLHPFRCELDLDPLDCRLELDFHTLLIVQLLNASAPGYCRSGPAAGVDSRKIGYTVFFSSLMLGR